MEATMRKVYTKKVNEEIKLSVIIPYYNSFLLMKNALHFFEQNYRDDVELIIVDDCSTDGSFEQLDQYARQAKTAITLLQITKNMGPGVARNTGINEARGEYITFLDADDYFVEETYDLLIPLLDGKRDLVICDYLWIQKGEPTQYGSNFYGHVEPGVLSPEQAVAYLRGNTCAKFYKRERIQESGIRFSAKRRCEDMPFTISMAGMCQSIFYIKRGLYCYVQHEKSIMHQGNYASAENTLDSFHYIKEQLGDKYPQEVEACYLVSCLSSVAQKLTLTQNRRQWVQSMEQLEKSYPNCYHNPYLSGYSRLRRGILTLIHRRYYGLLKLYVRLKPIVRGGRK